MFRVQTWQYDWMYMQYVYRLGSCTFRVLWGVIISQYWEHTQVYDHPNKKSRKPVEHKNDFDTYNNFKYSDENETQKVCSDSG